MSANNKKPSKVVYVILMDDEYSSGVRGYCESEEEAQKVVDENNARGYEYLYRFCPAPKLKPKGK